MANTSMTLGTHWESFIKEQIETGRYSSASEVVRAGLRELESRSEALATLRAALDPGIKAADNGDFVDNFDIEDVINRAKSRA